MIRPGLVLAALLSVPGWALAATPDTMTPPTPSTMSFSLKGVPAESRAPLAFEPVRGLMVFKMTVNGKDVLALLDTGASRSIVDVNFATANGLSVGAATQTGTTPTGTIAVRLVDNVTIAVPGQFDGVLPQIGAVDLASLQGGTGRKIEYIFGEDVLANMAIAVDPGRRTIQFAPSGASRPSANFPVVDLLDQGRTVELMIDGKPVRLSIDTGMTRALQLTPEAWARVGAKNLPLTMGGMTGADGQTHMVDVATVPSVSIGPIKLQNLEVAISPARGDGVDGSVGMGLLGRLFFVRDRKAGKLWLVPRQPSTVSPPAAAPTAPAPG